MRVTVPAIAVAVLILSSGVGAAPLCRDSKGLFTPCIGTAARTASAQRNGSKPAGVRGRADTEDSTAPARTASARPARPAVFGRGRLCRDTKGLFKPC